MTTGTPRVTPAQPHAAHDNPTTNAPRLNRVPRIPAAARDSMGGASGLDDDAAWEKRLNQRSRGYLAAALLVVLLAVLSALAGCGGGSDDEDAELEAAQQRRTLPAPPDCQAKPEACR